MPERQRRSWGLKACCTFSCLRPSSTDEHSQIGGRGYSRVIYCNDPDRNVNYTGNYVSTTKYNVVNFIPKSLFEQFRRVANIYFLVVACVSFSPLAPYSAVSVLLPLIVVIGVAMAKDALEDWRRMKQDKEANSRVVEVYDKKNKMFYTTTWQKIRVGDIVQVQKNQYFPADLVLLSSNYEEGICYVETANLDGETNLKVKNALEETTSLYEESAFQHFDAIIECEDPNENLYSFVGILDYGEKKCPLSLKQLLLRDSKLRNTEYAYGVAVFTGHDTKVMQNTTNVPSKRSKIERRMDKIIYVLFSILMAISLTGSFFFGIETERDIRDGEMTRWYLQPDKTTVFYDPKRATLAAFLHFLTGLMLYGYLIPISLYVSIEVVKVLQSIFINQDRNMYYEETNRPARAHTSSLNEELGQVDTVLTDKTGTLTCNSMEFVKCSIAGTAYGRGMTDVELDMARRRGAKINSSDLENEAGCSGRKVKGFNFKDERVLDGKWINEPRPDIIQKFLRVLAICHTAFPQKDEKTGDIFYEVESPDEAAFVTAAREFGFEFYSRTPKDILVREPDVDIPVSSRIPKGRNLYELDSGIAAESGTPRYILLQEIDIAPKFNRRCSTGTRLGEAASEVKVDREYQLLHVLEYTSSRKRMSVIVRNKENEILLLSKGADSVIFERLADHGREFEKETKDHIDEYAKSGLRTMVIAYRKIEEEEYKRWEENFLKTKTSLDKNRDDLLEAKADEIERNLILLGATAVEDKLQKGVPECIDKLGKAGIKIWLITGDKMETAINIGYSCRLLELGMNLIPISLESPQITELEKQGHKKEAAEASFESVKKQIANGMCMVTSTGRSSKFGLIIDGKSLTSALDPKLEDSFFNLAVVCATVICCRSSPKQKALVTRMVKARTGRTTLAIGDGANDVGMIHEADIGVGISGVEGMQAVMASDFSIAQFRFLERLLLVHGHWCYRRLSMMICYFFYKNIAFGLTLFWFEAYASFSAKPAYNDWYMSVYNVFFTSLPVIALGVFDQDVSEAECLQYEMLYQEGVENKLFSWVRILGWMANGITSSVIIFFMTTAVIIPQSFTRDGRVADFPEMAATMYSCVVWVVNCQMALSINYFTLIQHLFIWGSIALWYIFLILYGSMNPDFSTTAFRVFSEACAPSPLYWLVILVVVLACLLPYFTCRAFQTRVCPMYHEQIQLGLVRGSGSNRGDNRSIDIAGSDSEACIELQIREG